MPEWICAPRMLHIVQPSRLTVAALTLRSVTTSARLSIATIATGRFGASAAFGSVRHPSKDGGNGVTSGAAVGVVRTTGVICICRDPLTVAGFRRPQTDLRLARGAFRGFELRLVAVRRPEGILKTISLRDDLVVDQPPVRKPDEAQQTVEAVAIILCRVILKQNRLPTQQLTGESRRLTPETFDRA
jgi:hypothetical protein